VILACQLLSLADLGDEINTMPLSAAGQGVTGRVTSVYQVLFGNRWRCANRSWMPASTGVSSTEAGTTRISVISLGWQVTGSVTCSQPFPGALAMLARPGLDVVRGDDQLSTWRYLLLGAH